MTAYARGAARPIRSLARAGLALVLALVLVLGAARLVELLPSFGNPFSSETVDRTGPAVLHAIEDLQEFRAATANLEVVVDVEDDTRYVPSWLKGERTLFVAAGNVDASVDFRGIGAGDIVVSEDGKAVTVNLPAARLGEAHLDVERSRVVSRDRGLVDRVASVFEDSPTSERSLYLLAERRLTAAAKADRELLERAEANTRLMLESLLRPLGFERVIVRFG